MLQHPGSNEILLILSEGNYMIFLLWLFVMGQGEHNEGEATGQTWNHVQK